MITAQCAFIHSAFAGLAARLDGLSRRLYWNEPGAVSLRTTSGFNHEFLFQCPFPFHPYRYSVHVHALNPIPLLFVWIISLCHVCCGLQSWAMFTGLTYFSHLEQIDISLSSLLPGLANLIFY
jgi:hypothetical protein